jgi:serine/threonine-protein kinase RsbW
MDKTDRVTVEVTTSLEVIDQIQTLTSDICELAGFNEEETYWITMAVREAVNNAFLHGNRLDDRKKVFLSYEVGEDAILIGVRDEGPGFSKSKITDPLLPENILKGSGRGLFYIERFMDSVDFSEVDKHGAKLVMMKKRSGRKAEGRKRIDAGPAEPRPKGRTRN